MFIEKARPGEDSEQRVEDEKSSWSLASDFRGLYRSFGDQYRWGPEQAKCLRPFRCNSEGYVEFFFMKTLHSWTIPSVQSRNASKCLSK